MAPLADFGPALYIGSAVLVLEVEVDVAAGQTFFLQHGYAVARNVDVLTVEAERGVLLELVRLAGTVVEDAHRIVLVTDLLALLTLHLAHAVLVAHPGIRHRERPSHSHSPSA